MKTAADLCDELDRSQETFLEYILQRDPKEEIYPGWGIKELIAHFAGWDQIARQTVDAYMAGTVGPPTLVSNFDSYNQHLVEKRQDLNLEETVTAWKKQRSMLKDALSSLEEKQLEKPLPFPWGGVGSTAGLAEGLIEHEDFHLRELKGEISRDGEGTKI